MRSTAARAILAVVAVTALAGVLRFYHLDRPQQKVFDELYYASDGCWYAGIDYRECGLSDDVERSWVHPPLGKQLIAVGIDAFGNTPFGWRASAATAGTVTVALVGILAFLLFRRALWAFVAALLLATEHLHFVQSRVAMLDVFLAMFVILGFLLLLADRRVRDRWREPAIARNPANPGPALLQAPPDERADDATGPRHAPARRDRRVWRPLRLLAGAAFGAAIAVKWSGVLALAGAIVLAVAWERTHRKHSGKRHPLLGAAAREGPGLLLALALVPFLVYLVTWVPWLADRGFDMAEWVRHHFWGGGDSLGMAEYHLTLETVDESGEPVHPYMSRAWTWFLLVRPVAYYWQGDPSCCREILGIGNPVLFWGSLVVVPFLAVAWRRDWRAGVSLVPILFQYVPWLLVTRPLFLFYMTPLTPFLALGTAHAIRRLARVGAPERGVLAPVAAAVVLAAVAAFWFFWPVLVGSHVARQAWEARILFPGWT